MTAEQINRIRAALEAGERRQREAQQASSSSARSDLSDATSQSLPAGVPIHSMATDEEEEIPSLETPTEVAEEEEEDDDETEKQRILNLLDELHSFKILRDEAKENIKDLPLHNFSLINPKEVNLNGLFTLFTIAQNQKQLNQEEQDIFDKLHYEHSSRNLGNNRDDIKEQADELFEKVFSKGDDDETQVPPQSRKHKETIDYNENLSKWRQSHVTVDDILFQLHLRGIPTSRRTRRRDGQTQTQRHR